MTIHEDIAKERYLDLRADGVTKHDAMTEAISDADFFTGTYAAWRSAEQVKSRQFKGCPTCFGSGGKRTAPCDACKGTGRVPP